MQNYDKNGCSGWQFFTREEQVQLICIESGKKRKDLVQDPSLFKNTKISKVNLKILQKIHMYPPPSSINSGVTYNASVLHTCALTSILGKMSHLLTQDNWAPQRTQCNLHCHSEKDLNHSWGPSVVYQHWASYLHTASRQGQGEGRAWGPMCSEALFWHCSVLMSSSACEWAGSFSWEGRHAGTHLHCCRPVYTD